jgi:DNA primase
MPGIDYREARQRVRLAEVLELLDFEATVRSVEQVRGPCAVHRSRTAGSRSFAAHLGKGVWKCFSCGSGGNALDLWAAVTRQPLHAAVIDLYGRLGREVPWLRREREQEKRAMPEP